MITTCIYECDNKTSEGYCKTTGCINPKINQIALTLNSPITEEQWDIITDVDLDNTPRIIFQTKHDKEVEYVKVVRCKDCRHRDPEDHKCDSGEMERQGCPFKVADDYFCAYGERGDE